MKCIKCGITVKSGKGNLNYVTFGGKEDLAELGKDKEDTDGN